MKTIETTPTARGPQLNGRIRVTELFLAAMAQRLRDRAACHTRLKRPRSEDHAACHTRLKRPRSEDHAAAAALCELADDLARLSSTLRQPELPLA